jgi:hypothetical protein
MPNLPSSPNLIELQAIVMTQASQIEQLKRELHICRRKVDSQQARIDALMLEYAPNDMSLTQLWEWASRTAQLPEPQEKP